MLLCSVVGYLLSDVSKGNSRIYPQGCECSQNPEDEDGTCVRNVVKKLHNHNTQQPTSPSSSLTRWIPPIIFSYC